MKRLLLLLLLTGCFNNTKPNPTSSASANPNVVRHEYLLSGVVVKEMTVTPFSFIYWEPSASEAYAKAMATWRKTSTNYEPRLCILNVVRLDNQ